MAERTTVAVVGASGFVGQAVCKALADRGAAVIRVRAPRLPPLREDIAIEAGTTLADVVAQVAADLGSPDAVVNAAGVAESGSGDKGALIAANGALPGVLAAAAAGAGARFVHVSSAAVQGSVDTLDATDQVQPFSAYSESKVIGERAVRAAYPGAVIYRPPGVHAADRRVTATIARVARSPLSSVARPGTANTAQALLANVGDAIAFLAITEQSLPPVVIHPSEGISTVELLHLLGGREPRIVPRSLAGAVVAIARTGGRMIPQAAAVARRLEMLWFGQDQDVSWLTEHGWAPPTGREGWAEIGRQLRPTHITQESR